MYGPATMRMQARPARPRPHPAPCKVNRGRVGDITHSRMPAVVYAVHMSRTNLDIDDNACAEVMRRYGLSTKREAVNLALRTLASEPLALEEARQLRGSGWQGDLDDLRTSLT